MKLSLLMLCFFVAGSTLFAQKQKIKPLQTDVHLTLLGPVKTTGQQLVLEFSTEEVFECEGYTLAHTLVREGNKISVKLKGLVAPPTCDEALDPARLQVPLPDLPDGQYDFKAVYRNYDPFLATLHVTPEGWKMVVEAEAMITLSGPKVKRIPPQIVWGSVLFQGESEREIAAGFLQDLENEQCAPAQLKPGNYGAFYLRTSGKQAERKLIAEIEQPFVYTYTGDFERLRLLVKMYAERQESTFRVRLFSAKGEAVRSRDLK